MREPIIFDVRRYALSKVAAPPGTIVGASDLDAPQPKYAGASLRKVAAARVASFAHALGSFGWSLDLVRTRWPALRALAARRGLSGRTLFGAAALPSLAYDAQNDFSARACLCHSLGYFVQELLHVLLHEPDPIFVAHHIAYTRRPSGTLGLSRLESTTPPLKRTTPAYADAAKIGGCW